MIRLLGYESEITEAWPHGHMKKAKELGIIKGLELNPEDLVTRGDVAVMIMQSLNIEMKGLKSN
ncbi:S-layer homology domain-containing protein [Alkaliphilus pronyensis]|uniref:S-layer homology domain-containing protein n=1 Tax=Alkaliphilus pronyensis TaxID=1482732 RepID=A0A6I0F8D4_9FIRM|nr:S-layer homology domain-containing protein [Alkaliphilus pronyensis]KAB3531885.1 S-layer homology domain-containing protein [Alkaliphilus pronyensis]